MTVVALGDIKALALDTQGAMWEHIRAGDPVHAVSEYNWFLRAIGTPGIADSKDMSTFEGRSPFLGSLGARHLTTPEETRAIMAFAEDYYELASAKLRVSDLQGVVARYGEVFLPHMGEAITLATSVVAGKTPSEPEFAKLIGYTSWAASPAVGREIEVILSGKTSDYRIFPSADASQRFSLQTEKGEPIVTRAQLQAEIANTKSSGIFVYHYDAQDMTVVPDGFAVRGLKSHTHKNPTNYPSALTGMGIVNTLSGGLSVINLAKDTYDGPAVAYSRWEESARGYLEQIAGARGLSSHDIDVLSRGIQLTTNRGWDSLTATFGAVTSHRVGLIHQQERDASEHLTDFERGKIMLELGAQNGYYVDKGLSDAELEQIAKELFARVSSNNGRVCVRPDLVVVHEDVYARFAEVAEKLFAERDQNSYALIGFPLKSHMVQGSFFNQNEYDEHLAYRVRAQQAGAGVIGGRAVHHDEYTGLYASPLLAIFEGYKAKQAYIQMREESHEVFSSVMNLMPVSGVEEAIDIMNRSSLCLSDGVATHDIQTVLMMRDRLLMGGSFHVNLEGKRVSDEAPANAHGHGANPPVGIRENAGVTGGLDCLRQMFNVAHQPAQVAIRLPKVMVSEYMTHYGLELTT